LTLLSIVVPVLNEASNLQFFYERTVASLLNSDLNFEILFIDDGSTDNSFEVIDNLALSDERVVGYKLSRNFGHQNAVTCGLHISKGDAVVIIDADLQDPPELIPQLVSKWREGFKNVYCVREKRKSESYFKKITARIYYLLLAKISDYPIPINTGDFRLIDRQLLNALIEMKEENRFLRGMIAWLGFPTTSVLYQRDARYSGSTSYTMKRMIKFAQNGIFAFSSKPLKLSTYLGIFGMISSLVFSIYLITERVLHPENSLAGFATIMLTIIFFGSLQLLSIGLLGEYLQRIYIEVKGRPLYIIQESTLHGGKKDDD
jgi:dolichol-phosphate mannosyltransferase